jgi:hypothetical protein
MGHSLYGQNFATQVLYNATCEPGTLYYSCPYPHQANPIVVRQEYHHQQSPGSGPAAPEPPTQWPVPPMPWPPPPVSPMPWYLPPPLNAPAYYSAQPAPLPHFTQFRPIVGNDGSNTNQPRDDDGTTFMTQIPPAQSDYLSIKRYERLIRCGPRPESFIRTVARKVHISRPPKCAWNYATAQLHSMVKCSIARSFAQEH